MGISVRWHRFSYTFFEMVNWTNFEIKKLSNDLQSGVRNLYTENTVREFEGNFSIILNCSLWYILKIGITYLFLLVYIYAYSYS